MHFCAENGQAVKWQPVSYCHECSYWENNSLFWYFAFSINTLLYVSSSWGFCSSCWALKPLLPRQMDTQYRQKHMKARRGASESRGKGESCQRLANPVAGGAMRWHWAGACQAGLGALCWSCFGFQLGWLAVLAGQALAPPASGTYGISRISHQAQPSGGTVCLVTLCQNFMCATGEMWDVKMCPSISVKALFDKQNWFL